MIVSVKIIILDIPGEKLDLVHKKLRHFFLKRNVEETDRPRCVTSQIVNDVNLIMNSVVKDNFVLHDSLLDTRMHKELAQEVLPALTRVCITVPLDWLLLHLLFFHDLLAELISPDLDLLVLDFVLGEVGDLNDAASVL